LFAGDGGICGFIMKWAIRLECIAIHSVRNAANQVTKHSAPKNLYLNAFPSRLERETDRSKQFPRY